MSEPFLGEIRMVGFNFAAKGWALCNGQLLSIAQNTALFSLLGTTYGGDGITTFALPNLQGRLPMHWGNGPGLSGRVIGEMSGSESVTLISTQIPAHNHPLNCTTTGGATDNPTGTLLATSADANLNPINTYLGGSAAPNAQMAPTSIGLAGGSQPHDNMPPFLCVTFIIALEGIYPSRN